MTAAQELIRSLENRDIRLAIVDGRLRVDAPKGALTSDLRRTLEQRRSELIDALRVDWASDAAKVIAALPEESLRPTLTMYYRDTVGFIERETGCARAEAEQQAFGLLLFQIIRSGTELAVSR